MKWIHVQYMDESCEDIPLENYSIQFAGQISSTDYLKEHPERFRTGALLGLCRFYLYASDKPNNPTEVSFEGLLKMHSGGLFYT